MPSPQHSRHRIAILGGGLPGLATALALDPLRFRVDLYEAREELGGMARSWTLGEDRASHHCQVVSPNDKTLLEVLERLGLRDHLRWRPGGAQVVWQGEAWPLSGIEDVGGFRMLTWRQRQRMRRGLRALSQVQSPDALDMHPALPWLFGAVGPEAGEILFRPPIERAFGWHAPNLSAAWAWSWLRRMAPVGGQPVGCFAGGSQALLDAIITELVQRKTGLRTGARVTRLNRLGSGPIELCADDGTTQAYDGALSSIPPEMLVGIAEDLPDWHAESRSQVDHFALMTTLLQVDRPITGRLWTALNDPGPSVLGVFERTAINPLGGRPGALLYAPSILPRHHHRYAADNGAVIAGVIDDLAGHLPGFRPEWVTGAHVARESWGQPVFYAGQRHRALPMTTPWGRLFVADATMIYPACRTIDSALALGFRAAKLLDRTLSLQPPTARPSAPASL